MSLSLSARVEARDVDLALTVPHGTTVAVLGPNGAGKSTLLAVAAGLLRPDAGRCEVDGVVVHDLASGTWTPPHARGVALLAQEPLLFPHLSARDNVAFGPRSRGSGRAVARERADHWLSEVDASALADRRPGALSGGQAQRVAVARALAAEPAVLLLDEPMAALDVAVAPVLRQVLRRVLAGRTAVVVTHDVLDALVLASTVVVVEGGRVVETGPTHDVLTRPRSAFAARIAGLNLLAGTYDGAGVRAADGVRLTGLAAGDLSTGEAAVAVFSPASVSVHVVPPGGSPRNVLAARVTELEPRGAQVRVRAGDLVADVTAAAVAELDLVPGSAVHLVVKASEVAVYAG